jgi:hypothetical protein
MTFETEIRIALNQHFGIHRAVRVMAFGTTFPHGLMLEHKCASLFLMTLCAGLIQSGKRKPSLWLVHVASMWIMAVHTVH